jgi:hypothetical protein
MFESSDLYKYAVTISINYKDICFYVARDIRYHKIIPFEKPSDQYIGLLYNEELT